MPRISISQGLISAFINHIDKESIRSVKIVALPLNLTYFDNEYFVIMIEMVMFLGQSSVLKNYAYIFDLGTMTVDHVNVAFIKLPIYHKIFIVFKSSSEFIYNGRGCVRTF